MHQRFGRHKIGRKTVLTDAEELCIVEWARNRAGISYKRTRQEIASRVKKIIDEDGRRTPLKNNMPGRAWLDSFFLSAS